MRVLACLATVLTSLPTAGAAQSGERAAPRVRTLVSLSPVYTVDREYRSMKGPASAQKLTFPELDPPELLWITGFKATMVGADGESAMPQEYMCHSNLDFDPIDHSRRFGIPVYHTSRLFTLSQGQQEIRFPPGFGLPYSSDESFSLATQVLDLNFDGEVRQVRHKIELTYVLDRDTSAPMKPLFMTSGWGLVLLEGDEGFYGVEEPEESAHGESCLPGEAAGSDVYTDGFERRFSGHWVVPPGRQVNRTLVTKLLKIPYDTTVHSIAVHLHPFAESLELIDLTDGRSLFESRTEGFEDKIGLARVDSFSSAEGIPVFADHEYQLVSTYDNTTSEDQDSMAVMLLYLHDKQFLGERADRTPRVAHAERPVRLSDERVRVRTDLGDLTLALYPDVAPKHVEQFLRLVRLGVYDTTQIFRVVPGSNVQTGFPHARSGAPLSPVQKAALRFLDAEFSDLEHRRGTVSMTLHDNDDPHSAVAAFFIALGRAEQFDGRYTIFGEVVEGLETLAAIERAPRNAKGLPEERIEIRAAEVVVPAGR